MEFDILKHDFVPKQEIIKEEELEKALSKYNISEKQLPKITKKDPVVKAIGATVGDVIKITRKSLTAKEVVVFRVVIDA